MAVSLYLCDLLFFQTWSRSDCGSSDFLSQGVLCRKLCQFVSENGRLEIPDEQPVDKSYQHDDCPYSGIPGGVCDSALRQQDISWSDCFDPLFKDDSHIEHCGSDL